MDKLDDFKTRLRKTAGQSFAIAKYSVLQRLVNPRIICIVVLVSVYIWNSFSFVSDVVKLLDTRINPLVFPFFCDDFMARIVLGLSLAFLYSDAPFVNNNQMYVLIRSKRIAWALGQIFHVIVFSGIYFMILNLVAFIVVLPNATLSTSGWGKVINTLAQTDLTVQFNAIQFSYKHISLYSPIQDFVLTFLLSWGMASFIGLMMFALNLNFGKLAGALSVTILIFFDLLVYNSLGGIYRWISPLTLSHLSALDPQGITDLPSLTYAFCFYCVWIVLFSVIIVVTVRGKAIEAPSDL